MEDRDFSALRGLIREKLGSEQAFAKAIGRSNVFVSNVFNGKAEFSSSDIWAAKEILDLTEGDVDHLFFRKKVAKSET